MDSGMMTKKKKVSCVIGAFVLVLGVMVIAACSNPVSPKGKKTSPNNKTALIQKIDEAQALFDSLAVSNDGTDVPATEYWVESKHVLDVALEDARAIAGKSNATDKEIQAALEQLTTVYDKINEAKKKGNPRSDLADKSELLAKIAQAETLAASLQTSIDGNEIPVNKYWVTTGEKSELTDAISAAKGVASNKDATEAEVAAALEELTAAYDAANSAKKLGTKSDEPQPVPPPITDKSALREKIAEAEILYNSVIGDINGDDVPPNKEWVSHSIRGYLKQAIDAAKVVEASLSAQQAAVDTALETLIFRYEETDNARLFGNNPDKTALIEKITEAIEERAGVKQSSDGKNVSMDEEWVTSTVWDNLQAALSTAEQARDNEYATVNAVRTALESLETALDNFNPLPGTSQANKDALNELIGQVNEKLASVEVSVDGRDVYTDEYWVSQFDYSALETIRDQAVAIAGDPTAMQVIVNNMTTTLGTAFNTFKLKLQAGRKSLGQLSLDIRFNRPGDENITLSGNQTLSWTQNGEMRITVTETFSSYQWLVDGAIRNGETGKGITLQAREFGVNTTHTVTLKVTKSGVPYTKTLQFTVVD